MLCYVMLELLSCLLSWSRIEAMRSAFWSAESEALHSAGHCGPLKTRLYHSAKHCGPLKARLKTMAKSQIFLPFFYIKIMNCCYARYARSAAIMNCCYARYARCAAIKFKLGFSQSLHLQYVFHLIIQATNLRQTARLLLIFFLFF